ncbi:Protein kinase, catalytic domain [Giardia duodenalis]|uniref:Protein kinase, catalytic domain n=1 Tax=Giardia intestinalis TaxID=5741 RepID=V6U1L7_GIAIN|nr:Protein kinase, catalytic domain [Giardia intestinalis]
MTENTVLCSDIDVFSELSDLLPKMVTELGKGVYGTVFAIEGHDGLAVKEIQYNTFDEPVVKQVNDGEKIMEIIEHENVVKWHKVLRDDRCICIIMDRYKCSLDAFLRNRRRKNIPVDEETVLDFARQIGSAFAYLHSRDKRLPNGMLIPPIVHGDVKPANILITEDGKGFALADFSFGDRNMVSSMVHYVAPEVRTEEDPTPASDMWSFGVILYEFAVGNISIIRSTDFTRCGNDFQLNLDAVSYPAIRGIIRCLLVLKPANRMTAKELCDVLASKDIITALEIRRLSGLVSLYNKSLNAFEQRVTALEGIVAKQAKQIETLMKENNELKGSAPSSNSAAADLAFVNLITAVKNDDVDTVRMIVNSGIGVGKQDSKGMTAMMHAAEADKFRIVELLVEHEKHIRDKNGWTALMRAAQKGSINSVRLLVKEEGGMQSQNGMTALMEAITKRKLDAAAELVECEAGFQDRSGCTALMYAAEKGIVEIVTRLLDSEKGRQDGGGMTALMKAAAKNRIDVVEVLVLHEAGLRNKKGETALEIARDQGHFEVADILEEYTYAEL